MISAINFAPKTSPEASPATIKNFLESNSKMFRFRIDVLRDLFTPQQISQLESTRQKLEELTEINSQLV